MPNDNTAVCGCGVVLDLPKSRNGMTAISTRNFTILIPKANKSSGKVEGRPAAKKPAEMLEHQSSRCRGPNSRAADCHGSTSSVAEQSTRQSGKSNKKDKRISASRRTRSAERAERAESHYTYIDSGSSIIGSGIRENAIAEALYCTIDDDDESEPQSQQQQQPTSTSTAGNNSSGSSSGAGANLNQQVNSAGGCTQNNRPQQPVYAVPSMTSPPPTYDVAIAKSWQSGLPPSYEEYLCHKHALLSRSHTPPPPWTDSSTSSGAASLDIQQMSRELLASQPELREYLTQLALQGGAEQAAQHYHQLLSKQQALRKQASRAQRTRAMPPRSQSESRAHQQRIATMYEDGAFCMETTAIQSAFENGVAFCSLM